jgi:branched-chain amino acid aminotransferase
MDCDNTTTDVRAKYIWMNGEIIAWQRAQVHVFAHALHFGSSVFEGLRAYDIGGRPFLFRGPEHFERLLSSCRMSRIPCPLTVEEWVRASADLVRANGHRSAYIRPLVFRGGHALTLDGRRGPVQTALITVPMDSYLGREGLTQGIDVQVSSWRRPGSNTSAPFAKIGGQYVNNQAVAMEAHDNGFAEGIALDAHGYISEGSGENVFVVYQSELFTPSLGSSILNGITRASITTIARYLGYTVT